MSNILCMNCFKVKGEYEVCPHCGYVEGTPPSQAYHLMPGTILENRYIVGTCIGFGGFGITYRAYDSVLNIQVAIKEFYPSGLVNRAPGDTKVGIFSGEKEAEFKLQLERFMDEAKNMAIFSKEKDIVNVYHYFHANGTAYTVMEYINGILLKTWLREHGKMEVKNAVAYMTAILSALEKIHEHGIIHKDVSPDNIFLMGEGKIKIFDFGAARFPSGQQDKTFSVVIKSGYAPPEQYRSSYQAGAFMDIYAAGAVFYEMITGVRPGEGTDRAIKDDLQFPSKLGIVMDANLEKIIMKSLSVKPEHRFQTAREFRECIEQNTQVLLPEEEMKKRAKRKAIRIGAAAVGGAAVLIALTAGVTWYLGKDKLHTNQISRDTVSLWLVSDPDSGEEADEDVSSGQSDAAEVLMDSFRESCPKVTLEITEIPEEEYASRIKKAQKDGSLPDVFCTDYLKDEADASCAELSKLYHTIETENYKNFEILSEDGMYEMPTGIQVAVVYENYEKFQLESLMPDQSLTLAELKQIPEGAVKYAEGCSEFASEASSVKMIAGDLSDYEDISEVTLRATPVQQIVAVPVLDQNGNLEASFCEYYGVNKNSSKNRQDAGMAVISCMLTPAFQEKYYMDNYRALPVHTETLEKYRNLKLTGYLEFAADYMDRMSISLDGNSVMDSYYSEKSE